MKTSHRNVSLSSLLLPSSCRNSGAQYIRVPLGPLLVIEKLPDGREGLQKPKSAIFMTPDVEMSMFSGLTFRWTNPLE
jgi:hypothetical protein